MACRWCPSGMVRLLRNGQRRRHARAHREVGRQEGERRRRHAVRPLGRGDRLDRRVIQTASGVSSAMDWKLELVILPVSDVDRAKDFYSEQVGFNVDVYHRAGDHFRVVQLTPPGSACSVTIGVGLGSDMKPGSVKGLHLIVSDVDAACRELAARGVELGPIHHFENGASVDGPDPTRADYGTFSSFNDPDGNTWVLQEVGFTPQ